MELIKSFNNNIVLAKLNGRQVIAIGKGIGFAKKEGDFIQQDKIDTVFNFSNEEMKKMNLELLNSIDIEDLILVKKLVSSIEDKTGKNFNSSMIISLADHIENSLDTNLMEFEHPMRWIVKRTNPDEYSLSKWFIDEFNKFRKSKKISKNEVTSITLHFINNQSIKSMSETMNDLEEINTIINIIEYKSKKKLNKKVLDYSRFIVHLRFLLNRLKGKEDYQEKQNLNLYGHLLEKSPKKVVEICYLITNYLSKKYDKDIDNAEKTYLLIYLNRII
ncbi:PRD domain-containing protein [Helcococcus ovis]|uniref:PRD domain-containing protein n=1 Tax=Helcococcus ovis TaxID=72026 RepID=UPI0038BB112A